MFILKKGHQPGVYVPLRALFLVCLLLYQCFYRKSINVRSFNGVSLTFYWLNYIDNCGNLDNCRFNKNV